MITPQGKIIQDSVTGNANTENFSLSNLDPITNKLSLNKLSLFNHPLAIWISGNVSYGKFTKPRDVNNHFTVEGITSGVDMQFKKSLILGAALGYSNNNSRINSTHNINPAYLFAHQTTGSFYTTYQPIKNLFIDGMMGFGVNSLNNNRNSDLQQECISSKREGHVAFGSLGTSKQIIIQSIAAQPFFRGDIVLGKLGQFVEPNDSMGLTYAPLKISNIAWSTGLTLSTTLVRDQWLLSPLFKTEYTYNSGTSTNQSLFYTNLGIESPYYNLPAINFIKNIGSASLWFNFKKNTGFNLALGLSGALGSNAYQMNAIELNLSYSLM